MAQISNGVGWLSSLPGELEFTPAGMVLLGFYALCVLAGLAVDIGLAARWLAARRHADGAAGAPAFDPGAWMRRCACLQGRPWTWREASLILLVLLGAQLAAQGARFFLVARMGVAADSMPLAVACQGLGFHGVGLAALAWSIRRRKISWAQAFGIDRRQALRRVGQGLLGYLAVLPPFFAAALGYQLILFRFGYPLSAQNVILFFMEPQAAGALVLLLILAVGLAPLAEEALFRGVALPLLARTIGVLPAIALTAAGFALIHFHVPALVPLFVLAASFAVAYIVTESLWVPFVMHALFNGMNIGLILLTR